MTLKTSSRGCRPLVDAHVVLDFISPVITAQLESNTSVQRKTVKYFELNCNLQAVHANSVWCGEIRIIVL